MISKFFSKASPIHFVIITMLLFVVFFFSRFFYATDSINALSIVKLVGLFGLCFLAFFVFDFFTTKNRLTKKNSYKLLFYGLLMVLMPQTFINSKLLLAHLFILLAFRRIVSLRSKKEQKKKLLDATIWICLATLLYFWSSLFFIMIFAALFLYQISDIKNWFIPLIGICLVFIITYAFLLVLNIPPIDYINRFNTNISFNFNSLNISGVIIAATIFFSYFLWSSFYYLRNIKNKTKSYRPSYILMLIAAIIALVIIFIVPEKTGSEFIFLIAPLAIIVANYVELISEKWFKEVLIWILIVAPFLNLIL